MTLTNTWSDAARAASIAARRAKAHARMKAYEADYKARPAALLAAIRTILDRQRARAYSPPSGQGNTSADDKELARLAAIMDALRRQRARIPQDKPSAIPNTGWTRLRSEASAVAPWAMADKTPRQADEALANTGWTDEARAASLAVRRKKGAARKAGTAPPEKPTQKAGDPSPAPPGAEALAKAKRDAREAIKKRRRDKERQAMFQRQREIAGPDFVDNWYPQGTDGANENPFYGTSTPAAPYGYYEGTTVRRIEPLYDSVGNPIIPRQHPPSKRPPPLNANPLVPIEQLKYVLTPAPTTSIEDQLTYIDKVDHARKLWGPFGKKYRFMMAHPNATEADWEAEDAKYLAKRAKHGPPPSEDTEPDPVNPWQRVPKGAYVWQPAPRYAPGQSAPELRDPRTGKTKRVDELPPRKRKPERPPI